MVAPIVYNATSWSDGPGGNTSISSARLNNIEAGVTACVNAINALITSSVHRTVVSVTTSQTLPNTAGQDVIALVGAGGAPILPTAVGNGNQYTVKNIDTTDKTITTTSSQTIDGATTLTIASGDSVDLVSDSANWWLVGG